MCQEYIETKAGSIRIMMVRDHHHCQRVDSHAAAAGGA